MTTLNAKALLGALKTAQSCCKPNRVYDVLQCLRLEVSDGRLSVNAFNLEHDVLVDIEAVGDLPALLVNGETLVGWLSKVALDQNADLSLKDDVLAIKVGKASSRFPTQPLANWGALSGDFGSSCIVAGGALCEALKAASAAVSNDESRPWLCGVHIESGSVTDNRTTNRLAFCGTNGVMQSTRDIAVTGLSGGRGATIGMVTADAIQKIISATDTVTLSWGDRLVEVKGAGLRLRAVLVEGVYPERWRGLAPNVPAQLSYEPATLQRALATVAAVAPLKGERRAKAVRFKFEETITRLETSDSYSALSANDECEHSMLSTPLQSEVVLGVDQLAKLIEALDAETVLLSIPEGFGDPVKLTGAALNDRFAVLVSIRS